MKWYCVTLGLERLLGGSFPIKLIKYIEVPRNEENADGVWDDDYQFWMCFMRYLYHPGSCYLGLVWLLTGCLAIYRTV